MYEVVGSELSGTALPHEEVAELGYVLSVCMSLSMPAGLVC